MLASPWRWCLILQLLVLGDSSQSQQEWQSYDDNEYFSALSVHLRPDGESRKDKLIRCAQAPAGSAECFDTAPPEEFVVRFFLANGQRFAVRVFREWAPIFAQRFWQTSNLGWWENMTIYRNVYANSTLRFVSQFGASGIPEVNAAWTKWKSSNATAPALKSNLRGRMSFSMGAVLCKGEDGHNPCVPLRPNCTADDYCALGFSTEIFVNYQDNPHLDSHGFAPFGEVEESDLKELGNLNSASPLTGMRALDYVGEQLGPRYGEVTELCPAKPSADASPYCVYRDGRCAGVNLTTYNERGNPYIAEDFPEMFLLRIVHAEVAV